MNKPTGRSPITLFHSWSHRHEALRRELEGHLAALVRFGRFHDIAAAGGFEDLFGATGPVPTLCGAALIVKLEVGSKL